MKLEKNSSVNYEILEDEFLKNLTGGVSPTTIDTYIYDCGRWYKNDEVTYDDNDSQ